MTARLRDGGGIHAAILVAVGKHGDEDQLKGESVHEDTSSRDFFYPMRRCCKIGYSPDDRRNDFRNTASEAMSVSQKLNAPLDFLASIFF